MHAISQTAIELPSLITLPSPSAIIQGVPFAGSLALFEKVERSLGTDLARAIKVYSYYPALFRFVAVENRYWTNGPIWSSEDAERRRKAIIVLNRVHVAATSILTANAKRQNVNIQPVLDSADHCTSIFSRLQLYGTNQESSPRSEQLTWPDCLLNGYVRSSTRSESTARKAARAIHAIWAAVCENEASSLAIPNDRSKTTPTIIWHGEKSYSIDGFEPISVTDSEHAVLNEFVNSPSMDTEALTKNSGNNRAPRVLRQLTKKYDGRFAPAIKLPGIKGRGGYAVAIRTQPK